MMSIPSDEDTVTSDVQLEWLGSSSSMAAEALEHVAERRDDRVDGEP